MEIYLSPKEVSARVPGMSIQLLASLRFTGAGPKFLKPSPRKVVYRWSDVEEWLASKAQTRTDEAISA